MQKQWDTRTHVRGARLQPSTVSSLHKTITRVQRLHNTPHHTSYQERSYHKQIATALRLYKSPDWVPMNRVNISDQHGLHSLKTLKKHQVDIEIDTGAGCNVMPLYKVQELFGQE